MTDFMDFLFGMGVMAILFSLMGLTWAVSASTIGEECEKMGQFYVAKKVYECKLKELK
jgi:hypothetical protein